VAVFDAVKARGWQLNKDFMGRMCCPEGQRIAGTEHIFTSKPKTWLVMRWPKAAAHPTFVLSPIHEAQAKYPTND
jgi:hypothetical protein